MDSLVSRYAQLSDHVDTLQALVSTIDRDLDLIYRLAFGDMSSGSQRQRLEDYRILNFGIPDSSSLSRLANNITFLYQSVSSDSSSEGNLLSLMGSRQQQFAAVPRRSPLASHPLTIMASGYGLRVHPYDQTVMIHQGIDFSAPEGTLVYATAEGIVIAADTAFWGYGTMVIVDHGHGFQTRYAHLDKYLVSEGDRVKRGQVIAQVGNTGRSTAPHLHYEVLLQGVPINPIHFLAQDTPLAGEKNLARLTSLRN